MTYIRESLGYAEATSARNIFGVGDDVEQASTDIFGLIKSGVDQITQITNPDPFGLQNTAADFKQVGGVCKPKDKGTLAQVVFLQKQANRVAHAKGLTKISADGDIGPLTLILLRAIGGIDASSCMAVGQLAHAIGNQLQDMANSLGVPSTIPQPPLAKVPSFIDPKTNLEVKVPGIGNSVLDAVKSMSLPMKLGFVGILGGIGYFVFLDSRKKGKR